MNNQARWAERLARKLLEDPLPRTGQLVSVHDRLSEMVERYGPGSIVTCFIGRAEPNLVSSVTRTQRRFCEATA